MAKRMLSNRQRGRLFLISFAGLTAALAILCLALLVSAQSPPIRAAKTASTDTVSPGDTLQYTLVFTNDSESPIDLVRITDTLPSGFAYLSMESGSDIAADPDGTSGIVAWNGPFPVPGNEALRLGYDVQIDAAVSPGTFQNQAQALLSTGEIVSASASVAVTNTNTSESESSSSDEVPSDTADTTTQGPEPAPTSSEASSPTQLLPRAYLPIIMSPPAPEVVYRLAYDSKSTGNFDIFAIDADGSNLVNVSNQGDGDLDPVWSPDGTKIAWVHFYSGKGEILVANANGSAQTNVSNSDKDDRAPDWAPDGSKIAFASYRDDRWEVYTVNPDGSGLKKITDNLCQSHDPVWSPDGTKIAYVCGLDQWAEVYVSNADGSNTVRLTDNEVPDEALSWAPDNNRLVYVQFDGRERRDSEIWKVNITTGTNTQLTDNNYKDVGPDWSPDGTKIAFSTYIDDSYEIVTMKPDGTDIVNLTHAAKADYTPRWSPDGLMIAFISYRNDDKSLYAMNADGSNQVRLDFIADLSDTSQHIPEWKPR
jgi:uncharacterized repeat protein (TIGR01451 family)